jgi:TPR repeat protein
VPAATAVVALPSTPPVAAPDHNEVAGLLARGRAYLSEGDVALARLYLRRAAERHDPQAALALGGTYDPAELRRIGIPNFQAQADPAKAREWYSRAADLGSAAAALRLERLP